MGSIESLRGRLQDIYILKSLRSLCSWDQQCHMPPGGVENRARQKQYLDKSIHQKWLEPEMEEIAVNFRPENDIEKRMAERVQEIIDRYRKIPVSLSEELAMVTTQSMVTWVEARQKNDFEIFRPSLEKVVNLKRQLGKCLGDDPYTALANEHEYKWQPDTIENVFFPLRDRLIELLQKYSRTEPRPPFGGPIPLQKAMALKLVAMIGYDFDRGKVDTVVHPFCSNLGPGDVRITTRYNENDFLKTLYPIIHEAGHALYEQGIAPELMRTPLGSPNSSGLHESQSLFWENRIGRSKTFFRFLTREFKENFFDHLPKTSVQTLYQTANQPIPSFIRVEAGELSYPLHIFIRLEIEKGMIDENIAVSEVPEVWNSLYKKYLGLDVPNNALGCLQDVHWSLGYIGYFPTYALGHLYAAQWYEQAEKKLGNIEQLVEQGQFLTILQWLRKNIHCHGSTYSPAELVEKITGGPLSYEPFLHYVEKKLSSLTE